MSRLIAVRPAARVAPASRPPEPPRRRRPLPPVLRRAGLIAGGTALVVLAATVYWGFASGWVGRTATAAVDAALAMTADAGLAVQDVLVTGRNRTGRDELLSALAIERGSPILSFDPAAARAAVVALPWVRDATVERRFPDTVFLRIEERQPLALWQSEQTLRVIDADGIVLAEDGLQAYGALPLVVGEAAPDHAASLLATLAGEPTVADRVEAAILVAGRRWDLRLDNGVAVRLPEDGIDGALRRLSELEAKSGLFDRDILSIDLRLDDRLMVQVTPGASERRRLPGEDT